MYRQARTGRPIAQFHNDLRTGNLPQVTWILAHPWESEHPRFLPASGQDMVHQLLAALWRNPAVWARTAFILMWDENDGQFDHVAPPVPDPGTPGEFINGLPIGLGFRVPCLVISPFSRGGYVCSDTFDHTSVLRLLETRFGVEVPNLTPWRRGVTGDLTSAFGFGEPPRLDVPRLPDTGALLSVALRNLNTLPAPAVPRVQRMPTQERGKRRRRGTAV
jgi:phospholipase C